MKQSSYIKVFILSVFLCAGIFFARIGSAHLTGISFEATSGDYFLDLGWSNTTAHAHEPGDFDLRFLKTEDDVRVPTDFDSVEVALTKGNQKFFDATIVKPVIGPTFFTYTFPDAGNYTVTAKFFLKNNTLAMFTLPVEVEGTGSVSLAIGAVMLGVLLGFTLALIARRKK